MRLSLFFAPMPHSTSHRFFWSSGKFLRIDYAMLPNCEWNQKQKPLAVSRRKTPDEKMISWKDQISQTILHGRDAILRVRDKWLIFNMVAQLWADVKYHVPTGFGFSPKASGIYPLNRYSIDVNSEDERRWGHKKALGLGSQGLRLMIVIESVYFITFAEEVVPSV